jgi:hypothetical protein
LAERIGNETGKNAGLDEISSGNKSGGDFSFGGMFAEAIWLYAGNSNRFRVESGDLGGL